MLLAVPLQTTAMKDHTPRLNVLQAPSRAGLLTAVTDTLTALGLEVGRAQVDNDNGSMVDTFFVQKLSGKKIEPGALHMLSQAFRGAGLKQRVAWGFACIPTSADIQSCAVATRPAPGRQLKKVDKGTKAGRSQVHG